MSLIKSGKKPGRCGSSGGSVTDMSRNAQFTNFFMVPTANVLSFHFVIVPGVHGMDSHWTAGESDPQLTSRSSSPRNEHAIFPNLGSFPSLFSIQHWYIVTINSHVGAPSQWALLIGVPGVFTRRCLVYWQATEKSRHLVGKSLIHIPHFSLPRLSS